MNNQAKQDRKIGIILISSLLGMCIGIVIHSEMNKPIPEVVQPQQNLTDEEKYQYVKDKYGFKERTPIQQEQEVYRSRKSGYNRVKRRDRELDRYIEDYIDENREYLLEKYRD
jgi:hypothetical protein